MRQILRWILGIPDAVSVDFLTTVAQRLDDLEDAGAHMDRRFVRLQQQVTRWSRYSDEDIEDEEDEVLEAIKEARRG